MKIENHANMADTFQFLSGNHLHAFKIPLIYLRILEINLNNHKNDEIR